VLIFSRSSISQSTTKYSLQKVVIAKSNPSQGKARV
jgi:hypothetical protein